MSNNSSRNVRLDEQLHRFRSAMILCFAAASLVYALVLTASHHASHHFLQQMASLGVALWLVGFLLMFFVGYYSIRRRVAAGGD